MSVIRTLSASESNEQRDREKAKLEKEYKRSDQKLDELMSLHDQDLTQVMQVLICDTYKSIHVLQPARLGPPSK
jgi:exocyst complex component 4